jgi:hypothetical protein
MDPVSGLLLHPVMQGLGEFAGNRFEGSTGLTEKVVMVMPGPFEPGFAVSEHDGLPLALVDGLTGGAENGREIGMDPEPGQGLPEFFERPGMRLMVAAQEGVELGPDLGGSCHGHRVTTCRFKCK